MKSINQTGMTLTESLAACALLAALLSLSPSIFSIIDKQRLASANTQLSQLILQARSYALTNNVRTTLCHLDQQQRCSSQWQPKLSLFLDSNGNRQLDHSERLLAASTLSHVQLDWRGMSPANSLHFNGNGHTFVSNGTFTLCHINKLDHHYQLVINRQGRLRSVKQSTACRQD